MRFVPGKEDEMRSGRLRTMLLSAIVLAAVQFCSAQHIGSLEGAPLRVGLSGGMGVNYLSMTDVVDLANYASASLGGYERLPEFKAAAEFFGAVSVPCSPDWVIKFEYAYVLTTYNVATAYGSGQAEYTAMAHLPSLIVQYVLVSEPVYNVKVGAGGGYHFGILDVQNFTQNDRYRGRGPGFLLDAEGNTALGENVYAYLGVNIRWDFIGKVTNDAGLPPSIAGTTGNGTTMDFFGLGARLGFTYYF
jgi:hypothetical protein